MREKLILPWGWGTGVNDLHGVFPTLFSFDAVQSGAVLHPASSRWSWGKPVSTLGCSFCPVKNEQSAVPAVTRCFSDCRAGGTGGCRAPELQLQKNWRCCLTLRGTESQRQPVPRCASQPCAESVRITQEGLEVPDFILGSNFVSPNPRDSSLQGFGLAPKVMTGSICKLEMTFGFPGPPSVWAGLSRATSTSRCLGQSHV